MDLLTAELPGQLSIELASWATAWEHEARGYHGKWIKAGTGLDRYSVPDHSRLVLGPKAPARALKDPASHPWFKAHPISAANIIAAYDASTPQERAQGERWYADAHNIAAKITDGNPTEGAILLAGYSPQSPWPVNLFNAARAAEEHRALGPGDGMITHAMQANAQEALDGKPINEALTSPKTRAFARLIELGGDAPDDGAGEVVVDRHAMSVAAGHTLDKVAAGKIKMSDPRLYGVFADTYRQAALEISKRDGKVMPPYVLQAITWLHQQARTQAEDAAATAATTARGGKGAGLGRTRMVANAWQRWMKYAKAQGIPLDPGITSLAMQIEELLSPQIELAAYPGPVATDTGQGMGISDQIELGYNPAELRAPDGEWMTADGPLSSLDKDTQAVALAQRRLRQDHPRMTMQLGSPQDASQVLRSWLVASGLHMADSATVEHHPHPERLVSNSGHGMDGEPAVFLHPDRWDYGTLAHEGAHLLADYVDHHGDPKLRGSHGPAFLKRYAALLSKISKGAGQDLLDATSTISGQL